MQDNAGWCYTFHVHVLGRNSVFSEQVRSEGIYFILLGGSFDSAGFYETHSSNLSIPDKWYAREA